MSSKYNHLMTTIANQIPTMSYEECARQVAMFRQTLDGLRQIANTYAVGTEAHTNTIASMTEVQRLSALCWKRAMEAQSEEFRAFISK